jgi:hypothetical protein
MHVLHDTLISMNAILIFKVHPKINLTIVLVSLNCKYPKKMQYLSLDVNLFATNEYGK